MNSLFEFIVDLAVMHDLVVLFPASRLTTMMIMMAGSTSKTLIKGTLVFFCGKMGSGKTTLSRQIAQERNAVLLSEDEWLGSLYPDDQISTVQDYVKYSNLLKPPMKSLVQSILKTGTNVVMDYPANTLKQRQWFHDIYNDVVGANHELIYLDVSDDVCLARIEQRREELGRITDTPEMFIQMNQYFVPPTEEEGFSIITKVEN